MMALCPALAAFIPPSTPRHDITVALGARPPSRISSQPMMFLPFAIQVFLHTGNEIALQLIFFAVLLFRLSYWELYHLST